MEQMKRRYSRRRTPLEIIEDDIKKEERRARRLDNKGGTPRKTRRARARAKLLPKIRVCPRCHRAKPRSRQWDVSGPEPMCRGCARIARRLAAEHKEQSAEHKEHSACES